MSGKDIVDMSGKDIRDPEAEMRVHLTGSKHIEDWALHTELSGHWR